ncbi:MULTISPECIES: aspartate--tRNA ligase [Thermoanaerobacter]|jgi:aspartyl-tRNA synthetase|uniref:Aspartate--tRNA(Asp/Asn) ligase n=2 Tax=Thermoanaerobacter TaxID=1754 RepID=SYDND_THEP3|nr:MULTISPECIES: aspartate--tRNA ligase [Thermoanaerobacter]B0K978.1 RecName: Full=Aspartate--tRNA(Asp/Asn) ligase; AltName: Full=Aspartyl-tRNA synthetase; Short=AspRS; AltName: Full=Non-discriminating aspartyl-tRNA synthetase; Short=ND-AspRS [Thermoanaerobacter pseudethanolicus ATCC 33223]ABY94691.1 aspartyl-tRNA synthetase [Thermoanaerobacter pseudethanolicus ATCC 33223]ADV79639.1 aspartyl-tRNA synthetase [Thermoanaerobacter brockii subsp. finnii Ako-1]HBW60686.1 aspartate--tRNA ligase [Therm
MGEQLNGLKRTHMCGELTVEDVDKSVVVMGWVQRRRDHGGLVFIDLRDRTGIVQVVFSNEVSSEAFEKVQSVRSEYVLAIEGKVVKRAPENVNPKISTGEIEIYANTLKILSKSETPPFPIEDRSNVSEAIRLKYRYLDLRRPSMQQNLMTRFKITKVVRDFLNRNGFIEIETPLLIKSTPEGARDYLVPSRIYPGKFYALPQSPQIFKQLLMISGFDKYYQIAKCLRDEDLRADRQPEFTQIDIEMSFVEVEDVLKINEKMIAEIFKETLGIDVPIPFKRLSYQESMERFGTDKPDLRFGMELKDLSDIVAQSEFNVFKTALKNNGSVRGINVKGAASMPRRQLDELVEFAKTYGAKGLLWIQVFEKEVKSPATKFLSEEEMKKILERLEAEAGDLLLIVADKDEIVFDTLAHLRLELGKRFNLIDENKYEFVWIVDFPLLEYDEGEKRYVAKHHPFTAPKDEDIELLEKEPLKVRAKAYDIVLNGTEIGGGSIRIHDTELQKRMFKVLGFSEEKAWERFGFLMEAFKYGAPPHGGIAYGLDRLAMIITGSDTIRDVIAFPKTQNAVCLMTDAPSEVSEEQLKELHIKVDL